MTKDESSKAEQQLAAAAALYEQYLEIARTTIAPTTDELARPEFFAPPPAPLTLTLAWSNDVLMERPSK